MALPTYTASGTQAVGTGAVTPGMPASHQTNDVFFLVTQTANEAVTLSDPQGFGEITGSPLGTGVAAAAFANRLSVFWKRAGTSNDSAPTVTDPGDHVFSRIFGVRGAYAGGIPYALVSSDVVASIQTAVTIPAGSIPVPNCFLAFLVANSTDTAQSQLGSQANATVDNLTEVFDGNTNNGVGGGICFTRASCNTAGAFGATTASLISGSPQVLMALAVFPTDAVFSTPLVAPYWTNLYAVSASSWVTPYPVRSFGA